MIDEPIVIATRRDGKTLRIECPHCHHYHTHGTGGVSRLYMGHRLAHCADRDLPKHLRQHRGELGYHIIDLTEVAMTEKMMRNLFAEMDVAADEMRKNPLFVLGDDQIIFRQLQRAHFRHLTKQQWLDLFEVWRLHYLARQEAELAGARARMAALWEERDELFAQRASLAPQQRAAATARIETIAREIAGIAEANRNPTPSMGAYWAG